jgi:hypothetical protein
MKVSIQNRGKHIFLIEFIMQSSHCRLTRSHPYSDAPSTSLMIPDTAVQYAQYLHCTSPAEAGWFTA